MVATVVATVLAAAGWLLVAAAGAGAVEPGDYRVTDPPAGGQITGPIVFVATVDSGPLEQVEVVEMRLLRNGSRVGPVRAMDYAGGERNAGTSRWERGLNPLSSWTADGEAMPNGPYQVEIRVISQAPGQRETTNWAGHTVNVRVAPPATTVSARVVSREARTVEVSWEPVPLPDFRRYVVQRAPEQGGFTTVAELTSSNADSTVDVVPDHGTWRYRVQVVRASGNGGELSSTSAEQQIEVPEPAPPNPTNPGDTLPGEDDPDDGSGDDAGDDPDGGSGDDSGDGVPAPGDGDQDVPGTDEPGDDGQAGDEQADEDDDAAAGRQEFGVRRGRGTSPSIRSREVPAISTPDGGGESSAPPPEVDPGQQMFEEVLPYDQQPQDRQVTEVERELVDHGGTREGGTLAIYDRELMTEEVLQPVAAGLLLFVLAGHVLRFSRGL